MENQALVDAITKALGYAENGGKPDINNLKAGKTGEMKSIFQFTPDTWDKYSTEVFGKPGAPLDPDTETFVVHQKVGKWTDEKVKQGKPPEVIAQEIASMWNAGEGKPDAYKENWRGVNKKYGVKYDTPAYAKKVADYTKEFMGGTPSQKTTPGTQSTKPNAQTSAALTKLKTIMQEAKNNNQTKKPSMSTQPGMINQPTA